MKAARKMLVAALALDLVLPIVVQGLVLLAVAWLIGEAP